MNAWLAHFGYVLALIVAITVLLFVGFAVFKVEQCKNIFRAWDKLGASIAWRNGFHTISAHCGAGDFPAHNLLRPLIDAAFGEGHCEGAARKEGLLA